MRALLTCLAAAIAAVALTVEPARACSCVPPDPWSYLERADGAFIGRLISRREDGQGRAFLVFSVERAVKGRIGGTVEVETASGGAACGIEASVGRRVGLFLVREDDHWFGHLCWQVSPADLLAAASLPAPNGRGPVALYVGGRFGHARTLALDGQGRTLAYGVGRGTSTLLSPCPGGERIAEVAPIRSDARMRTTYEIALREAGSLRIVRREAVRLPGWRFATGLLCEDAEGSSVVVFANWAGDSAYNAAIYRLSAGRLHAVWNGIAFLSSLTRGIAYLNADHSADRFVSVDLETGRVRQLARLPRSPRLVPNATRRKFAGVAYRIAERSRLFLVDLTMRPPRILSTPLAAPEAIGTVEWLSGERLLFLPSNGRERAQILDLRLRTLARFRWTGGQAALVGSNVFGMSFTTGGLVVAKLPSGPQRFVRKLPGKPYVIVAASS